MTTFPSTQAFSIWKYKTEPKLFIFVLFLCYTTNEYKKNQDLIWSSK